MKLTRLALPGRLLIGSGLIAAGLIAASVGALVALPEHGAALRSWIGAPLPGRHERVSALQWWITPIERSAFARRHTITAGLNDLAVMDDGRTILVVGDNGALLESVNAGATWRSLADNVEWRDDTPPDGWASESPPSRPALRSVAASPGGSLAIAVGDRGAVLTSDANGATWTERTSGSLALLRSVAFDASTGRAIAVGDEGTVLTSDDNGATWTERDSDSSAWHVSVAFDASTGRAIAMGWGTVFTSDDNGATWTERTYGSSVWLRSVAFDGSTGRAIAVGDEGTVLTSDANGAAWTERDSGFPARLRSVAFDASTRRAIAVGVGGTVLISDDNGVTWTERASGSSARLFSVAFDGSTGRAIAVGNEGTVLTSDNNGLTWTERAFDSSSWLFSVAFDGSTGRAIAVGNEGTVLTSEDNGATWSIVALRGRIYPAPLSVLGLFLSLGGLTLLRYKTTPPQPPPERIIDLFVSDRPLGSGDPDRLGYGRYIQGLSGLLRNRGTGFPITIAVTGEWGAGKSSFMRLLEADLKRRGYFAAWFNAWHDQNEENVLSSLLEAIRAQAIPRIFSRKFIRAIELRFYLLCNRGIIYVMAGMATLVLAAAVVSSAWRVFGDLPSWKESVRPAIQANIGTYDPFYVTDATIEAACDRLNEHGSNRSGQLDDCNEKLGGLTGSATRKIVWSNAASLREEIERRRYLPGPGYTVEVERALLDNVAHVATPSLRTVFGKLWPELMEGFWQWLTAFAAAAILIANGASAFGFNLRRGVSGVLGAAANSVDSAGRHEQLRRDFKNVSHSIGRNLVIFIDDLDRCQPEKVVETLEAVNFLVTAGECGVVIGMDYERVRHCVGLVRKDLAEAEYAAATHEGVEDEGRTAYAHKYLQKLVNVEMPIVAERNRLMELVTIPGPPAEKQSMTDRPRRWSAWLWRVCVWAILAGVLGGALFAVPYARDALVPTKPFIVVETIQDDEGQPTSTEDQRQPTPAGEQPASPRDDVEREPTTKPALDTAPDVVFWPVSAGFSLVLILILLLGGYRWLRERGRLKLVGDAVTSLRRLLRWATARSPFPSTQVDVVTRVRRLLGRPDEVRDSEAFEKALEIWSEAIVYDDPTPRTLKRFLNRLRYFAAMLHVENGEDFDWSREANLVALAALHHLNVDFLPPAMPRQLDLFGQYGGNLGVTQDPGAEDDEAVRMRIERILEACRAHAHPGSWKAVQGVGVESPWPPEERVIEQFRKLFAGIHV